MATTDEVGYCLSVLPPDRDPHEVESEVARVAAKSGGTLTGEIETLPAEEVDAAWQVSLNLGEGDLLVHRWKMTRPRVASAD